MLTLKNITCSYGIKIVLKDINFHVKKGNIVSILGANGSGKSTLLKAILGLISYVGNIWIQGREAETLGSSQRASMIAYVPQTTLIPFDFSVLDIVLTGRFHTSSFGIGYPQKDKDIAICALERIGIEALKDRVYRHLSGGERQLVLIARALAQQSNLIVMDEPVTGLDLGNQMRLLDIMQELSSDGYTILQTTHYPDHALSISDSVAWINENEIIAYGMPESVINVSRIRNIYGIESQIVIDARGMRHLLPLGFTQKDKKCVS